MDNRSVRAREHGPQLVLVLKIIFIISFFILALVDRNVKWFKKDQHRVAHWEAPMAGIGAALSFAAVGAWRRRSGFTLPAPKIPPDFPGWQFWKSPSTPSLDILKLGIISFIVFTILQIFFELAGFNELSEASDTASKKFNKTEKSFLAKKALYPIIFLIVFIVGAFAVCAWDSPPVGWGRFIAEGLIIGAGSAIPAYIVTRNRGGNTSQQLSAFGSGMVLFGLLAHPFLQYSGMYREFGFMKGN